MEIVKERSALINRHIDFWLLGGASLVVWFIYFLFDRPASSPFIRNQFATIPMIFSFLAVVCNHPHFIVSYRIAYGRESHFLKENWLYLKVLPAFLLLLVFAGYLFLNTPMVGGIGASSLFYLIDAWLGKKTIQEVPLSTVGVEIMKLTTSIMFLTVGWHYAKQVFGCIVVYAKYDNYKFQRSQMGWLKIAVFSIAIQSFFYNSNDQSLSADILLYQNQGLGFISFLQPIVLILTWFGIFLGLYFSFVKNWLRNSIFPSWNMIIPYIAFVFWWCQPIMIRPYYMYVVPFFHSLQYLPFAYRMEKSAFKNWHPYWFVLNIFLIFFVGFLAFDYIPQFLDQTLSNTYTNQGFYFLVMFSNIINIHHYFIDSIIWRFKDREVREALL